MVIINGMPILFGLNGVQNAMEGSPQLKMKLLRMEELIFIHPTRSWQMQH